jgi:hypothetical protein
MFKKYLTLVTMLVVLLVVVIIAPTFAEDFTGNKCFDEWDWCGDGSTDESYYWWNAGWCTAAIEAGAIGGTVKSCTVSLDDNYVERTPEPTKEKKTATPPPAKTPPPTTPPPTTPPPTTPPPTTPPPTTPPPTKPPPLTTPPPKTSP